ncbi:GntR family transcriptional regulator [Streptomyces camponoticapitis]|uniref:GntR family transcriptional regulator n=1 Tax=Streptomyces camponoticapitis TaxID=1616125 RepID=A0ABQ2E1Q9_9ACTN|nr:GntR family transcriptional regulator [Streptomyces camponoticapitis]GGJ85699.1 GntR family transcriptional regulator [Streptomyces camponoticapitis]
MEQNRARDDAATPSAPREQASSPGGTQVGGPPRVPDQARGEHTHATPRTGHGDRRRPASAGAGAPGVSPPPASAPSAEPGVRRTVRRHSVRGQILDALRTALVSGELVPGQVYSGPALGERFGVSATPVREAMQQLVLEGAVEVVPNRGFRVAERTARDLAELAEVRALIEVPVMLGLARTVAAERWAELRPLAEATVAAAACGDLAAYSGHDRAFHGALLRLSGNHQLVLVADELHRRAQWPLAGAPRTIRAAIVADAAEHSALLDALIAGDLPVVRSLVQEHFRGGAG